MPIEGYNIIHPNQVVSLAYDISIKEKLTS